MLMGTREIPDYGAEDWLVGVGRERQIEQEGWTDDEKEAIAAVTAWATITVQIVVDAECNVERAHTRLVDAAGLWVEALQDLGESSVFFLKALVHLGGASLLA